jgi:hypothetical protein
MRDEKAVRQELDAFLKAATQSARRIPLHELLLRHADLYNHGAQIVLARGQELKNPGLAAPAILCRSFAIELLLKCFIALPYPHVMKVRELKALGLDLRGHTYSGLWDRIEPRLQAHIADAFTQHAKLPTNASEFRARLIQLGDDPFVAWRYVYEKDGDQFINLELFGVTTDALGLAAAREINRLRGTAI